MDKAELLETLEELLYMIGKGYIEPADQFSDALELAIETVEEHWED
jgi:hypothetical protein